MAEKPFDAAIDHAHCIIEIQGIRYSFDLFDELAFAQRGTRFEIGQRADGAVELRTLPAEANALELAAAARGAGRSSY